MASPVSDAVKSAIIMPRRALEESRSLKSLNTTRNKYQHTIAEQNKVIQHTTASRNEAQKQLARIEAQIEVLLSNPREVIVTEHAILRFLERYEGLDLVPIVDKIKRLPETKTIRKGNSIVTVEI